MIAEIGCSRIGPIQAAMICHIIDSYLVFLLLFFFLLKKSLSDLTELSSKESKLHYEEEPNRNAITLCSEINGGRFQSAAGSPRPR